VSDDLPPDYVEAMAAPRGAGRSPASRPRSLAAATPDGDVLPGTASGGAGGSDSAKTEGGGAESGGGGGVVQEEEESAQST